MEKRQHFVGSLLRSLVVTRRAEFPVAALCILAATTFWFLNALNKEYTTRISYPVIFDYDRENLIATEPLPQKLALNVTGYGWTLLRKSLNIDTRPVVFRIENPLKTRYLTAASLLPSVSNQIKEAHVNFVENDTIAVAFDQKLAKTVALRIDSTQIELRQNHLVTTPVRISPDSVTFTGPAALVRKLPDVLVLNVPAKEVDENYEDEVGINYTQDPLLQASTDKAAVSFGVEEFVPHTARVSVAGLKVSGSRSVGLPIGEAEVEYWLKANEAEPPSQAFEVVADLSQWNRKDSTLALTLVRIPPQARNASLRTPTIKLAK